MSSIHIIYWSLMIYFYRFPHFLYTLHSKCRAGVANSGANFFGHQITRDKIVIIWLLSVINLREKCGRISLRNEFVASKNSPLSAGNTGNWRRLDRTETTGAGKRLPPPTPLFKSPPPSSWKRGRGGGGRHRSAKSIQYTVVWYNSVIKQHADRVDSSRKN
jgi:hypothetical protein